MDDDDDTNELLKQARRDRNRDEMLRGIQKADRQLMLFGSALLVFLFLAVVQVL